jgi:hypothetical protein
LALFARPAIGREEADGSARSRLDTASVKTALNMCRAWVCEHRQKALCGYVWVGAKCAWVRLSRTVKSHHFGDLSSLRISDSQRVATVECNDNE